MKPCPKKLAVLLSLIGLNLSWGSAAVASEAAPDTVEPDPPQRDGPLVALLDEPAMVAETANAHVVAYSAETRSARQTVRSSRMRANLGLSAMPGSTKGAKRAQRFVRVDGRRVARTTTPASVRNKKMVAIHPIASPQIRIRAVAVKPAETRPIQPATPTELTAGYLEASKPYLRTLAASETRQQPGVFTGEFDLPIVAETEAPPVVAAAPIEEVYEPIAYGAPVTAVALATPEPAPTDDYYSKKAFLAPEALGRAFARAPQTVAPTASVATPVPAKTTAIAAAPLAPLAKVAPTVEPAPEMLSSRIVAEAPLADWPWLQPLDGRASVSVVAALEPLPVPPIRVARDETLSAAFDIFDRELPAARVEKASSRAARRAAARAQKQASADTPAAVAVEAGADTERFDIFDPELIARSPNGVVERPSTAFLLIEPIVVVPTDHALAKPILLSTTSSDHDLAWYDIFEPLQKPEVLRAGRSSFDIFDAALFTNEVVSSRFDHERLAKLEAAVATGRAMLATREDALARFELPKPAKQVEPLITMRFTVPIEPGYNAISDAMTRMAKAPVLVLPKGPLEIPLTNDDAWDEVRMANIGGATIRQHSFDDDEPRALLDGTLIAVNADTLEEMRGGFEGDSGLKISFGIERAVYINGALVTTTSLNVADLSKLTGGAAASAVMNSGSLGLIQNGPNNSFQMGQVSASTVGTVIQNTLNNQNIAGVTMINATVNSLDLVKRSNLQSTIRSGIADSIRR